MPFTVAPCDACWKAVLAAARHVVASCRWVAASGMGASVTSVRSCAWHAGGAEASLSTSSEHAGRGAEQGDFSQFSS
jgi:hypothetical protein